MKRVPTSLDPLDVQEVDVLTFSYTGFFSAGETIASAVITCEVHSGTDATPATVLNGTPQIVRSTVLQKVQGGLVGVTYLLRCDATSSAGRVLTIAALLPVVRVS